MDCNFNVRSFTAIYIAIHTYIFYRALCVILVYNCGLTVRNARYHDYVVLCYRFVVDLLQAYKSLWICRNAVDVLPQLVVDLLYNKLHDKQVVRQIRNESK